MSGDTINKLKTAYIPGTRSAKIGPDDLEKIGNILVTEFVNKGKKFGTADVAEIIKRLNLCDFSKNSKGEARTKPQIDHAFKNAGYNVLVRLGVIEKKAKKEGE